MAISARAQNQEIFNRVWVPAGPRMAPQGAGRQLAADRTLRALALALPTRSSPPARPLRLVQGRGRGGRFWRVRPAPLPTLD